MNKKFLLVAVNAKYIHSSLAIKSLMANVSLEANENVEAEEFSINQTEDFILSEIYKHKPDFVGFSCYIWNIEMIKNLSKSLKKILPGTICVFGGPEATYNAKELLRYCDIIIKGEGEKTFGSLIKIISEEDWEYENSYEKLMSCNGIVFKHNNQIYETEKQSSADLNELVFPYESEEFEANKIIYYESTRGCPFSCGYCLSSAEKGVRALKLPRVYKELKIFLNSMLKQVKFVDRTFNCDIDRAKKIWNYLIENDNGKTNFHFEIAADLLDESSIELLSKARQGLFQFEIGVQSTNLETLDAVSRKTDLNLLFENVNRLNELGNIHLHLDLIAGLPEEDYSSFGNSFNEVYSLNPQQLQLGFLKLLHGSMLRERADEYGLVFSEKPPYEILYTSRLSYGDVLRLKGIEEMVEVYYNSGRYENTIRTFAASDAFGFYEGLSDYFVSLGYHLRSHSKEKYTDVLYEYIKSRGEDTKLASELLFYDSARIEKVNKIPVWFEVKDEEKARGLYHIPKFMDEYLMGVTYTFNHVVRNTAIVKFSFNVHSYSKGAKLEKKENFVLFNYIEKEVKIQEIKDVLL